MGDLWVKTAWFFRQILGFTLYENRFVLKTAGIGPVKTRLEVANSKRYFTEKLSTREPHDDFSFRVSCNFCGKISQHFAWWCSQKFPRVKSHFRWWFQKGFYFLTPEVGEDEAIFAPYLGPNFGLKQKPLSFYHNKNRLLQTHIKFVFTAVSAAKIFFHQLKLTSWPVLKRSASKQN